MHDWNKYIREHLSPLGLKPERELEIIEELALHLEGVYEDAVATGLPSQEAFARAVALIKDWQVLECELAREERPIADERLMEKGASQGPHQRGDWLMRSIPEDLRFAKIRSRQRPPRSRSRSGLERIRRSSV
jgi:hypothetical protein